MKDVNLDELVNKDKIDEVKRQMKEQYEADLRERDEKLTQAQQRADRLALDNAFNSSEFLNQRLAVPTDAARATYRDRFKVEDGKVVPLDERGEPLINKHGDVASVDEAFETYISGRSDKDMWLKAPDASGSGSQGGGGGRGGGNVIKRSDYEAMDPGKKAEVGQKLAKQEVRLVD
jgi:hypothetical protein